MPARATSCPPDEIWATLTDQTGAAREALLTHLAACSACRALVAELARQGALTADDLSPPAAAAADPADPAASPGATPALPARLGRFLVLELLGQGGMGTVLAARDPLLDRRVALKILRDSQSPGAHRRLLREAQALARIDHPNVVPVHEVLELEGQIILVMEHVAGRTLAAWVREEHPTWRSTARAYLEAARGLAAAHAAGLVHRDFKPSNALIGADGRVRVIDFGLVRSDEGASVPGTAPVTPGSPTTAAAAAPLAETLTRRGTLVGTPAYMAPEQFRQADVGPATDVYALCAALHEALCGQRPSSQSPGPGTGPPAHPPSAPSAVPRRLWRLLLTGLRADPGDRPTMPRLIDELAALTTPSRPRWIGPAALLSGAAIAAATAGLLHEPACTGGRDRAAPLWNPDVARDITRRLTAQLGAYGRGIAPRLTRHLADYTRSWISAHHGACMAHRRGEQSAATLDRRMLCLEERHRALASTIALLRDTDAPPDPVRLVIGLPALAPCQSPAPPDPPDQVPTDPALRARTGPLRAQLARAAASERSGQYPRARQIATEVLHAAQALHLAPLAARASLQLGRAQLLEGQLAPADHALGTALRHAVAADLPVVAAEALARRVYTRGLLSRLEPDTVAEERLLAEGFLQRVHDDTFARALLLNNVGVVQRALGRRDEARATLTLALDTRRRIATPDLELTVIPENLAAVTDDPALRARLFEQALRETETALGPHHPDTLRARLVSAAHLPAPAHRHAQLGATCRAWDTLHPRLVPDRALCARTLALTALELGDHPLARTHFEHSAALYHRAGQPLYAGLGHAHAALLRADLGRARRELDTATRALGTARHPWQIALRAEIDELRADIATRAGQPTRALAHALAAIDALDHLDLTGQLGWQARAASLRVTAATALLALGAPAHQRRARQLLQTARQWYLAAGPGYEARLAAIHHHLARPG